MKFTKREYVFWTIIALGLTGLLAGISVTFAGENPGAFIVLVLAGLLFWVLAAEYPKHFSDEEEIEVPGLPKSLQNSEEGE